MVVVPPVDLKWMGGLLSRLKWKGDTAVLPRAYQRMAERGERKGMHNF
jgi:hypothetical protein